MPEVKSEIGESSKVNAGSLLVLTLLNDPIPQFHSDYLPLSTSLAMVANCMFDVPS
jgi:hypothetical protein